MTKTREEIDAEKAHKSRPDLLPANAIMAAGEVMGYGLRKHGNRTWRIAGTEQADPRTHLASLMRHLLAAIDDPAAIDDESGFPHLACVITQACIAYDCEQQRQVESLREAVRTMTPGPVSSFSPSAVEGEAPKHDERPIVRKCPSDGEPCRNPLCLFVCGKGER